MHILKTLRRVAALALLAAVSQIPASAGFVQNPSFESNINTTWPHYGAIDLWQGGSGCNDNSGPFHNTGTAIPDQTQVAFKQGNGTLSQTISGLTPGQQYWVQFYYDARLGSGKVDITVSFNNVEVGKVVNVQPAKNKNQPYYFASFAFTPEVDTGDLVFTLAVTGDSTALYDAVTIVPRDKSNVVVSNPSFEASGDVPNDGILAGLVGWQGTGTFGVNNTDGTGAYANNGTAPDQNHVAFLNGESSLSQVVSGITPGKPYQVSFAYNAKTGNSPHLKVSAGATVLYEENVSAVGGANPYKTKTVTFTATDFSAQITIAQTATGDQTLLLDDVRVIGESAVPLPPLAITPSVAEISPGQNVTVTLTVPRELLIVRSFDIKLRSLTPAVASLVGADSDGILTLHFTQNGVDTQTFEVKGNARGSALLDVVDSATLKVVDTLTTWVVTSFVKNPSFESAAAPGGVGYGEILGWTGGSGVNNNTQPFFDNGATPDRSQVAVLQGTKSLSQLITGLTAGENYWLQFYYNARAGGGTGKLDLSVKLAGTELVKITDILPAGAAADRGVPFYFTNVAFKAASTTGLLEFNATAQGDVTLLLDAANIVQRDPVDIVVQNPSFEASGTIIGGVGYLQPTAMAGWTFQASGYGINVRGRDPFADNGANPDQDAVVFIQNAGSMSQTLTGLTQNKKYTVLVWANPRNCCSGAISTTLKVSVDDAVLLEEVLLPAGGSNPYPVKQVVFTAAGMEAVLKIEHAPEAGTDRSLVIDNIRVVPEGQIPPMIIAQPQGATRLLEGDNVTLTVAAMGAEPLSYKWQLNGVDLSGKTTDTLELTGITTAQGGDYTVIVSNSYGAKTSRTATLKVHKAVAGAFASGVGAGGALLDLGAVDPHFLLVDNPANTNSTKAYVVANPPTSWVANPADAQWIGPAADPQAEPLPSVGFYKYRLTFDLTGFDPANAFVAGNTAADEGLHDIYLNDQLVPGFRRAGATGSLAAFTITSGFQAGKNNLDIMVFNTSAPRPAGLLVQGLKIGAQPGAAVAPKLTVSRNGAQLQIAWPSSVTGYNLQSSSSLTGGWAADPAVTAVQGDQWVATITIGAANGAKFYRLAK